MTSLVASNQGLASILTEVSSIANYKKPNTSASTKSTASSGSGNSTALGGSDTAVAASLLSDLSSIAKYKRSNTTGDAIRPKQSSTASSNDGGVKKGTKSLARHSYTIGATVPAITTATMRSNSLKENEDEAQQESDNKQHSNDDNSQLQDPNENSAAFYDVFDFSMSEVDLPDEQQPGKGGPKRSSKSAHRAAMARKLERHEANQQAAASNNNTSVSETYNVFDFSLSTVDPKIIDQPTPKKRISQRSSIGNLSEDSLAAARARTRRAGNQVKRTPRDKQQQEEQPKKQQQEPKKQQRPGLVRRNSFGSVRDLNEKKSTRRSSNKGKIGGVNEATASSPKKEEFMMSTSKSPGGRSRRGVRGGPRSRRRASMGQVNQAQKQQWELAVQRKQVTKERVVVPVEEKQKMQAVRRLTKIQQSFRNASLAASEHHTTVITACPDTTSASCPGSPTKSIMDDSIADEEGEAAARGSGAGLQTLSQGVMSSLSTLSSLKKKLLRSNTMG